ncbi:MAG: bifunctional nicotinamidase/pyrazinamidase [Desulfobacca sp.]|nr:bifunctional nicotinamidase/pyrazinamidase [Desulfobacca sp.]
MNGVIVVDIQGDFTQLMSGSLAVPGTSLDFLHKINKAIDQLKRLGIPVWASQDWHPADHVSFVTNHPGKKVFDTISLSGKEQTLWPSHCVQGTTGADLLIEPEAFQGVIQKGRDSRYDSYSCFQDDGGQETELHGILKSHGIKELIVFGIATDYCVRWTALDGLKRGYDILFIKSLCRGVDPETSAQALKEIQTMGGVIFENLETWAAGKK